MFYMFAGLLKAMSTSQAVYQQRWQQLQKQQQSSLVLSVQLGRCPTQECVERAGALFAAWPAQQQHLRLLLHPSLLLLQTLLLLCQYQRHLQQQQQQQTHCNNPSRLLLRLTQRRLVQLLWQRRQHPQLGDPRQQPQQLSLVSAVFLQQQRQCRCLQLQTGCHRRQLPRLLL